MVHVHVVPGDSAAGGLRLALSGTNGQMVLELKDPLSCGPLRHSVSVEEWALDRRMFWTEVVGPEPNDFSTIVPDAGTLQQTETITLWLGNGLGDQIAIPWFCWLLRQLAVPSDRLRVVQFPEDFVPQHETPSLGMLSPEQIRKHPAARPLTQDNLDAMECLWAVRVALWNSMMSMIGLRGSISTHAGAAPGSPPTLGRHSTASGCRTPVCS